MGGNRWVDETVQSSQENPATKMLHNWQNIGQQKGRMRDSMLKTDTENQIEPTFEDMNCHICPSGCNEEERELHYLHCPEATVLNVREDLIRNVLKKIEEN